MGKGQVMDGQGPNRETGRDGTGSSTTIHSIVAAQDG